MGIDRKRVEELKGTCDATKRVVRSVSDLGRVCRAARTAGELVALGKRVETFEKIRLKKLDARDYQFARWVRSHPPTSEDADDLAEYMETDPEASAPPAMDPHRQRALFVEARALVRLEFAILAASRLPPDTPLDEHFWETSTGRP